MVLSLLAADVFPFVTNADHDESAHTCILICTCTIRYAVSSFSVTIPINDTWYYPNQSFVSILSSKLMSSFGLKWGHTCIRKTRTCFRGDENQLPDSDRYSRLTRLWSISHLKKYEWNIVTAVSLLQTVRSHRAILFNTHKKHLTEREYGCAFLQKTKLKSKLTKWLFHLLRSTVCGHK